MSLDAFRLPESPAGPPLRPRVATRLSSLLCSHLGLATLLAAVGLVGAAAAQTPGASQARPRLPVTELACPRGTLIRVLLQGASAPAYVTVDKAAADATHLHARTLAPQDLPSTLDLTETIGENDVFVSVRDRAPNLDDPKDFQSQLEGYIGCGGWQARVIGGQPNEFLLKRTASALPGPQAGDATTPRRNDQLADGGALPDKRGAEESVRQTPAPRREDQPADGGAAQDKRGAEERDRQPPAPRREDQRADRGAAQDKRGVEDGDRQRIASELRSLGLLGTWAFSCDNRNLFFRDIFVDQSGRSFLRIYAPAGPDRDRFRREIVGFQRLSANRFQLMQRGRFEHEDNAVISTRFRLENNQLFAEDVRTASGQVSVLGGRNVFGRFQGRSVPGFIKCRGPWAGAAGIPSIARVLTGAERARAWR